MTTRQINLNHNVEQLTLVNEVTGESDTIGASSHPFWVASTNGDGQVVPLANVWREHLREVRHYAEFLRQVTDKWIRGSDVRNGYVLIGPDGRRWVLSAQQAEDVATALHAGDCVRAIFALLSTHGWCFSPDLREGWSLQGCDHRLRLAAIDHERRDVTVYNFDVENTNTYFAGSLAVLAHNTNPNDPSCTKAEMDRAKREAEVDFEEDIEKDSHEKQFRPKRKPSGIVPDDHHVATNKKETPSAPNVKSWTDQFEDLFGKWGMKLSDKENRVLVLDHVGPHPEEYHKAVFDTLNSAKSKQEFLSKLSWLRDQCRTHGTQFNKWITRK